MSFKAAYIFSLLVIIFSSSCNSDNGEVLFEMEFKENFDIKPGLSPIEVWFFIIRDISTYWDKKLQMNNLTDADVDEVKATKLRITSLYLEEELDFIQEIEVFVFTDDESKKTDVAYSINVPRNTKYEINLAPALPNLKEFFSDEKVNIQIVMKLRETTTRLSTCRMSLDLNAVKHD